MTAADACPGIVDVHEARDGQVARIRLPGGYASATALGALAALAAGFGDGHVDLTARGNVQLRGIRLAEAGELAERAGAAGAGALPGPGDTGRPRAGRSAGAVRVLPGRRDRAGRAQHLRRGPALARARF